MAGGHNKGGPAIMPHRIVSMLASFLQWFDAVVWATGRAAGLQQYATVLPWWSGLTPINCNKVGTLNTGLRSIKR